jgi:hypothetical protein
VIASFASPLKGAEQSDRWRLLGGKIATVPAAADSASFGFPMKGPEQSDQGLIVGGKIVT